MQSNGETILGNARGELARMLGTDSAGFGNGLAVPSVMGSEWNDVTRSFEVSRADLILSEEILKEIDEPGVNLLPEGGKVSSQGVFNPVDICVKASLINVFQLFKKD